MIHNLQLLFGEITINKFKNHLTKIIKNLHIKHIFNFMLFFFI